MCLRVFRRGGAPVRGRPESTKYIGAALQLLRSPVELSRVYGVLRQQGPGRSTEPMAAASGAAVSSTRAPALQVWQIHDQASSGGWTCNGSGLVE